MYVLLHENHVQMLTDKSSVYCLEFIFSNYIILCFLILVQAEFDVVISLLCRQVSA